MLGREQTGTSKVVQPDEEQSFWQPVPANGFVRCILEAKAIDSETKFSMGTQTVAPGCHVREHHHDRHEEVIHFTAGEGVVVLNDEESEVRPGTTVFLGRNDRHSFINKGTEPMTFVWFLMPGGLEDFFAAIGRERSPGDSPPEPFARPENVAEIERQTVFGESTQEMQTQQRVRNETRKK